MKFKVEREVRGRLLYSLCHNLDTLLKLPTSSLRVYLYKKIKRKLCSRTTLVQAIYIIRSICKKRSFIQRDRHIVGNYQDFLVT